MHDNSIKQSLLSCSNTSSSSSTGRTWKPSAMFERDTQFVNLTKLRLDLFHHLGARRSASMDLIDSLACQQTAESVTDLSMQSQFVRKYSSVRDAIHYSSEQLPSIKKTLSKWGKESLPVLEIDHKSYNVFATDCTGMPHQHAECLSDRTFIHDASNSVTGKPINIGHVYSAVVGITENSSWCSPLCLDRIPSNEVPAQFGMRQAMEACQQSSNRRSIVMHDAGYNNASCLEIRNSYLGTTKNDPISIFRSACNRNYYVSPTPNAHKNKKYGDKINLYEPGKGAVPDASVVVVPNDKIGSIAVFAWKKVFTKQKGIKGYEFPSALIAIFEQKEDGSFKYRKPLVLRVFIPEDCDFNPCEAAWLYFLRFQIERFFNVIKQRLLFGAYSSPDVLHQEAFATMSALAYQQWYFAKQTGKIEWFIKPWERYPKQNPKGNELSPSHVQRGFTSVLKVIGSPSTYKKPNYIPPGRETGTVMPKRELQPVIKKSGSNNRTVVVEKKGKTPSMNPQVKKDALKIAAQFAGEAIKTKNKVAFSLSILFSCWIFCLNFSPTQAQVAEHHQIDNQYLCSSTNVFKNLASKGFIAISLNRENYSRPFEKALKISNDLGKLYKSNSDKIDLFRYSRGPPP